MKTLVALQDKSLLDVLIPTLRHLTWSEESQIQVIHVVQPPYQAYYADMDLHEKVHRIAAEMVSSVVQELQAAVPSVRVDGAVLEGDPKEEIIKAAWLLPADLIVVGSHGRGLMGRVFLGSVSLAVHSAAPCPVLIARPMLTADQHLEEQAGSAKPIAVP